MARFRVPQVAATQVAGEVYDRTYSGSGAGGVDVLEIAGGWFEARAALERLATLRADVAEALHRVRVALDLPSD